MALRVAKMGDIPRILEIMHEKYEGSIYKGVDEIDDREAKRLISACIQRHGALTEGAKWCAVSTVNGRVEGFIIGSLERCYLIGKGLSASDLFWMTTSNSDPKDAWKLYATFVKWAIKSPDLIDILPGVTAAGGGDYNVVGRLLQQKGFEPFGLLYRKAAKS